MFPAPAFPARAFLPSLALLALPLAAPAQPAFDPAPTAACVDSGGGTECIGLAANACIAGPDGATTLGMQDCFNQESAWWDARLNATYKELMAEEKARDAGAAGGSAPPLADALREMQRAWIPFRDTTCAYERARWGDGSQRGPATAECLMQETARQTLRLQRYRLGME